MPRPIENPFEGLQIPITGDFAERFLNFQELTCRSAIEWFEAQEVLGWAEDDFRSALDGSACAAIGLSLT